MVVVVVVVAAGTSSKWKKHDDNSFIHFFVQNNFFLICFFSLSFSLSLSLIYFIAVGGSELLDPLAARESGGSDCDCEGDAREDCPDPLRSRGRRAAGMPAAVTVTAVVVVEVVESALPLTLPDDESLPPLPPPPAADPLRGAEAEACSGAGEDCVGSFGGSVVVS